MLTFLFSPPTRFATPSQSRNLVGLFSTTTTAAAALRRNSSTLRCFFGFLPPQQWQSFPRSDSTVVQQHVHPFFLHRHTWLFTTTTTSSKLLTTSMHMYANAMCGPFSVRARERNTYLLYALYCHQLNFDEMI